MAGYIGSKAVTLSTTAADVTGDAVINGDLTVKGTTLTVDSAAAQEIRLGDNDKMTFGDATGGDLQIYHNGSHSYVEDAGSGVLILQTNGNNVSINSTGKNMGVFNKDGSVDLYYDNNKKLATTSTGVDITGTLTSDGLTVDGNAKLSATSPTLRFTETDQTDLHTRMTAGGGSIYIQTENDAETVRKDRFRIQHSTGDISFYVDTGTTAKFFWDASAESLGIGTISPSNLLELDAGSGTNAGMTIRMGTGNSGANDSFIGFENSAGTEIIRTRYDNPLTSYIVSSDTSGDILTVTRSGNLLVGKTTLEYENTAGHIFRSDGLQSSIRDGGNAADFNRLSSDGEIIRVSKDGTTVGSIGNNTDFFIASQDGTGLRFNSTQVLPCSESGATQNGSRDLGASGSKFKDGHFGGTVNAANFNTTSDATLKTNVETLTGSLDAVKALRGVSFDWIENGNSEVGVIAQEVEEVIPDVVSTNDQGIKSVKYGNLVGVLIEAIKEQQAQIDELKAQLNS